MVGKGECFWSSDVDHVKRSQPGVALEGILLNKQVMIWRDDVTLTEE